MNPASGLQTKRGKCDKRKHVVGAKCRKIRLAREQEDAKRGEPCNGWQGRVRRRNLI